MSARGERRRRAQLPPTVIGPAVAPSIALAPARAERYEELDGHRAIAVIGVVVFHVYQFCNVEHFLYFGTLGYSVLNSLDGVMPWFFALTAFLLFEPIARSCLERRPTISARGFLTRRAVRLLPPYYVAVVVVWFSRQHSLPGDWRDLLEHLTFTQVFDSKRIFYTIGPAWAISVEVFFYLGLAALGVGLPRICRRFTRRKQKVAVLAAAATALSAVSLLWRAWSFWIFHKSTTGSFTTWFGPVANLDSFGVGMGVAILVAARGSRPLRPRARLAVRWAGLTILVLAFAVRHADTWSGVYFSTLCALGFGALIAAAALGPAGDRWGRALSWRPLLWLGVISYSVYLWHEPTLLALGGSAGLVRQTGGAFVPDSVMVVTLSILIGWLSYLLIERTTGQIGGLLGDDGRLVAFSGRRGPAQGQWEWEWEWEWETFRSGNPI